MIARVVRLLFIATIDLRLSFRSIRIRGKIEKETLIHIAIEGKKKVESIDVKVPLTLEFR